MKMLKLPRLKVKIGTPLPWCVWDEHGNLLLSKGHVIDNERQLLILLHRGAFVDPEEVRAVERAMAPEPVKTVGPPPNLFGLWQQTAPSLKKLLTQVNLQPDFATRMDQFAQHMVELVNFSADIGIYCSVRQDHAKNFYYGFSHSVHTAMLCVLMARHLKWPEARMMSLVKAALTMNMSILELQGQMAAQVGPITDKQREAINRHPALAVAQLEQAGIADADWLNAIAQHHERPDGSGYPLGCLEVGELAVALRVADVFMAKISPRAMRAALSPQEAVRQLYREDKGGPLSTAVIKEFGIYPPGDFVKLASGELGVVVQRTGNAHSPIVAAITDPKGQFVSSSLRRDSGQAAFAIVANVTDKAILLRLPPERLYGFSNAPSLADPSSKPVD